MVTIPSFLLRKLYVRNTLKNTSDGFAFELRNKLGSGYAYKLWPLTVDGHELPLANTIFKLGDTETCFSAVTRDHTFTLAMNRTIIIKAYGVILEPGIHKIGMGFDVPGLGTLNFDFSDALRDD